MPFLDNLQAIAQQAMAGADAKAFEAILAKAHTAAYLAAVADRSGVKVDSGLFKGLSKAERADVKAAVKGQLDYLTGYLAERDDMSDAAKAARDAMYAGSIRATFNQARYPGLSQVPGDGQTRCLTACNCDLQERDGGIWWVTRDEGHTCEDCQAMADGSPYESNE